MLRFIMRHNEKLEFGYVIENHFTVEISVPLLEEFLRRGNHDDKTYSANTLVGVEVIDDNKDVIK